MFERTYTAKVKNVKASRERAQGKKARSRLAFDMTTHLSPPPLKSQCKAK